MLRPASSLIHQHRIFRLSDWKSSSPPSSSLPPNTHTHTIFFSVLYTYKARETLLIGYPSSHHRHINYRKQKYQHAFHPNQLIGQKFQLYNVNMQYWIKYIMWSPCSEILLYSCETAVPMVVCVQAVYCLLTGCMYGVCNRFLGNYV